MFKRQEYQLKKKTVLGRAIFPPPFKASSVLENEARFVHVVKGNSTLYFPNGSIHLEAGDSVIMKCEHFVNHWHPNEDGQTCEVIIFLLYPEVIEFVYDNQLPDVFKTERKGKANPVEKINSAQLMKNYIDGLKYYLDNPKFINDEILKIKVRELLFLLSNLDESEDLELILSKLFHPHEYEFKEIVHTHLYDDLKIEDLAFLSGMSVSSFKRKFKHTFQLSPGQYIKQKRLEKATQLLKNSNLRITEIAFDCGFNELSYFSKTFAAAYQLSPSEYRNSFLN